MDIKEEKAKEYARLEALGLEAQRFYDPNTSPEYYERLVETMEDIFEAGKQERDREIIDYMQSLIYSDEDGKMIPEYARGFNDAITELCNKLENLSK